MKKQFLETGRIVAVQGLKGEVRAEAWCDSPQFLCSLDTLYFDKGNTPMAVEYSRPHKNVAVIKLKGIDTPEAAGELRGKVLYMNRDDVHLDKGVYFVQDLLGLSVVDAADGTVYGELCEVTTTGANDVYHVKMSDGIRLIPAIPQVIEKTDIEGGKLYIRKMEGLLE